MAAWCNMCSGLVKFAINTGGGTLAAWGGSAAKAAVTTVTQSSPAWVKTFAVGAMAYTSIPLFAAVGVAGAYAVVSKAVECCSDKDSDDTSRQVLIGGLVGLAVAIGCEVAANICSSTDTMNNTDISRGLGYAALITVAGAIGHAVASGPSAEVMARGESEYNRLTNVNNRV